MATPEIGMEILHYRVLRRLGKGGMGAVYMAEDTRLGRRVALKFLPAEMAEDHERLRRFEREAQTVASLNHPNIVTVYSVEEAAGVPFIAMELVEGEPLSEVIPGDGLPLPTFLELAIPLADAVSAAHEKGITHRDLKPGNIMVGHDGRLKVLDFGLAKLRHEASPATAPGSSTGELTRSGSALGTVTYMAPEQLKGRAPDERADIFSLGIVLYQMLGGTRPFRGETSAEVISSILRDSPPPVTALKADLPGSLGRIVERCLDKNPDRRYRSAGELREDLVELRRAVEAGRPFEVDARTRVLEMRRRPHRAMTIAAVVALTLLAAAIGLLLRDRRGAGDPATSQAAPPKIIAVLPFADAGGAASHSFAAGLNEVLSSRLTSLDGLLVVSRATAARRAGKGGSTREIGESLGADYLVLGTVRWGVEEGSGGGARTTLEVVRVADDIQIWSASYDRRVDDELAVQSEIAQHLARAVGSVLLGLSEQQLPAPPEPIAVAATGEAAAAAPPATSADRARSEAGRAGPTAGAASASEHRAVRSEVPSRPAAEAVQGPAVTLEIVIDSFAPEGVLTIYADDRQLLSEPFRFEKPRGLLGRRRPAGSITVRRRVSTVTEDLRVYALVGSETQLTSVLTDFSDGHDRRLEIVVRKRGQVEARLR